MKKFLFGAMSVFLLTACSQDDVEMVNNANDEIKFTAIANNASRAAEVFCANNLPSDFVVKATYGDQIYIDADTYVKSGETWVNQTAKRYWPATGDVRFYAAKNAGENFVWNGLLPEIQNYTIATKVDDQLDLIYAVENASRPATAGAQTPINFRHALSQVMFKAKNTNKNIYVEIQNVEIRNIASQGTYKFKATGETTTTTPGHAGEGTYQTDGRGEWAYPETLVKANFTTNNFVADLVADQFGVAVTANGVDLNYTASVDAKTTDKDNIMILLPQETAAWAPNGIETPADATTGAMFFVNCKIWNVADGTAVNKATDVVLWDSSVAENGWAAIPVQIKWEEGKRYVYTFIFDENTTGGYDPNEPNVPVLFPISFNVTVDDFVDGGNTNVDMK